MSAPTRDYTANEPSRLEIDQLRGPALLEFGSPWCGYCRRAEPLVQEAFGVHPNVRHIKIADGRGRRLPIFPGEALADPHFSERRQRGREARQTREHG